jgi:ubiquinone/menaquinone biosynthesis C-methylase UbiE
MKEILLGRKQAAEFLGLPHNQKIVDIATGTGTLAYEFAKLGHSVIGIDSSTEMLNRAKKKYSKNLNIRFEQAEATHCLPRSA